MYKKENYQISEYESRHSFYPTIEDYEKDLPLNIRYTQYLDKSSCTIESFMAFFPDIWCPYYGGYALVTRSQHDNINYVSISDNDDYVATKNFSNREECKKYFDNLKKCCPLTTYLIKLMEFDR